jgi:hypothetical protein
MEALALASDAFKRIIEDRRVAPKPAFEETSYPSYKSARSTPAAVAISLAVIAVVAIAFNFFD